MGSLFSKKEERKPQRHQEHQQPPRKVQVNEHELVLAKMKVQEDRLTSRSKKIEKEEVILDAKIRAMVQAKKKEEAYFHLKQKKQLRELKKSTDNKLDFLQRQIQNVETTMEDVKFAEVIRDSNRAVEKLSKEIDLEELRIAKEHQAEGKIRREELNQMLEGDTEDDREIQDELNRIERDMIQSEFDKNPISPTIAVPSQKTHSNIEQTTQSRQLLMN